MKAPDQSGREPSVSPPGYFDTRSWRPVDCSWLRESDTTRKCDNAEQEFLTVDAVARLLCASRDLVEDLIHRGVLRAVDISASRGTPRHRPAWRIWSDDLSEFLASRRTGTAAPSARRKSGKGAPIEFV